MTRAPRWYAWAMLGLGGVAAVVLVGRPAGLGLALLGVAVLACGGIAAGRRDGWAILCIALGLALAAMPMIRAAAWVWLPCVAGALLVGSLAATGARSGRAVVEGLWAGVRLAPRGELAVLARAGAAVAGTGRDRAVPALRAGALAAILLVVFTTLFASADAAFASILDRTMPDRIPVDQPLARLVALVAVLGAGGGLLSAARRGPVRAARPPRGGLSRVEWALPLGSLVALFAVFVALQITTLFAGDEHVLRTAGLTYADYAHQGFGQLMAAAALTLAVVGAALRWARPEGSERVLRGLVVALCALCFVVLASALKRLGLYEQAYGFTRLRVLAHANILWLGVVLALVLAAVLVGRGAWLPRAVVAVSAAGALAFALANPDGWIAERNLRRGGELDARYLRSLSADAAPALGAGLAPCPGGDDGVAGWNLARARARAVACRGE